MLNNISMHVGCEFEVYKKTRRRVLIAYFIVLLAALSLSINDTFFFLNKELTLAGSIINGICGAGLMFWISLPPPAFGTEGAFSAYQKHFVMHFNFTASLELIMFMMGVLCAILSRYKIHLEEGTISLKQGKESSIVKIGFQILKLIRHAESTLGPMIATFYLLLFGFCCAAMFYLTGIRSASVNGIFYPALLLFCLSLMLQGLAAAILLSYMIRYVHHCR